MEIKSAKRRVKEINRKITEMIKTHREVDRQIKAASLQPGETLGVATHHGFYSEESKNKFEAELNPLIQEMKEIASGLVDEAENIRGIAPSTEAVNAITMLRGMEHPSVEAITAAAKKYGDNYLAMKAIDEVGRNNRVYLNTTHSSDAMIELSEMIDNRAHNASFNYDKAFTDGASALFDAMIGEE